MRFSPFNFKLIISFTNKISGAINGIPHCQGIEYVCIHLISAYNSQTRELGTRTGLEEAGTALIYLCDLVDSTASPAPSIQQMFTECLLPVMSALRIFSIRIKNEYTVTPYTNRKLVKIYGLYCLQYLHFSLMYLV